MPSEESISRTLGLLDEGLRAGLHLGAQLFVSRHGEPVADVALGEARPGTRMTSDTLMPWLSATKPLVAVAVLQLVEQQRLELDDRLANYLPELAGGGKEQITLRHVLTHTAGLAPVVAAAGTSRGDVLQEIYYSQLSDGWEPGKRARYDPSSGWYLLGALIEKFTGEPLDRHIRRELLEPLNMDDSWLALSPSQVEDYGERLGLMHHTQRRNAAAVPAENTADFLHATPGKSGRGPMRQLARFYEYLLELLVERPSSPVKLLSRDTLLAMLRRQRCGMVDETFRATVDWGLGLLLDSKQYGDEMVPYGYGRHASPATFGHSGNQSSSAFADPEHGLVVALVFNGMCGEPRHQRRVHAVLTTLYEDLGLA